MRELIARPSGSRTVSNGNDLDRQVEIGRQPPHDGELLGVFAAEVGAVGSDDRQQLGHDRRDAFEVAGPLRGFVVGGQRAVDVHVCGRAGPVHLAAGGAKTRAAPAAVARATSRASSRG